MCLMLSARIKRVSRSTQVVYIVVVHVSQTCIRTGTSTVGRIQTHRMLHFQVPFSNKYNYSNWHLQGRLVGIFLYVEYKCFSAYSL